MLDAVREFRGEAAQSDDITDACTEIPAITLILGDNSRVNV